MESEREYPDFAPIGEVTWQMAERIEAMAAALRDMRDREGRPVTLKLPWAAIHQMAKAAEDPAAYMKARAA